MFKSILNIIKKRKFYFIIGLLGLVLASVITLANPYVLGKLMDSINNGLELKYIFILVLLLVVISLISIAVDALNYYIKDILYNKISNDFTEQIFEKFSRINVKSIEDKKVGEIYSTMTNDIAVIAYDSTHALPSILINLFQAVGGITILFCINIYLGFFTLIPIPFVLYILFKGKKAQKTERKAIRKVISEISSKIENTINGIHTCKIFSNEEYEKEELKKSNNRMLNLNLMADMKFLKFFTLQMSIINVVQAFSYLLAAVLIIKNKITIGDFAAYYLYLQVFYSPMIYTIGTINTLISHSGNYDSYNKFQELEEEDIRPEQKMIDIINGDILIKNFSFSYTDGSNILNNINLHIESGQTVAFVGESGCGKSTLCKLLYKFYKYNNGSILVDGEELNEINPYSYRKSLGVVEQDSFMFATSIKENILYGKLEASFDEVIEAAKKAQIHDFIMSLPEGYDTFVGEKGVKLSGGQRQRISIARIFLKNPSFVILDEATSALDNITEREVQKALDELTKDRTCIIVAHRLSTVERADNIFVFEKNSIVEQGTHEELLLKGDLYYNLYNGLT